MDKDQTRIIELIFTQTKVGTGTDDDPVQYLEQLWTKKGFLIAQTKQYGGDVLVVQESFCRQLPDDFA